MLDKDKVIKFLDEERKEEMDIFDKTDNYMNYCRVEYANKIYDLFQSGKFDIEAEIL